MILILKQSHKLLLEYANAVVKEERQTQNCSGDLQRTQWEADDTPRKPRGFNCISKVFTLQKNLWLKSKGLTEVDSGAADSSLYIAACKQTHRHIFRIFYHFKNE